jgi:hypothetical protein
MMMVMSGEIEYCELIEEKTRTWQNLNESPQNQKTKIAN